MNRRRRGGGFSSLRITSFRQTPRVILLTGGPRSSLGVGYRPRPTPRFWSPATRRGDHPRAPSPGPPLYSSARATRAARRRARLGFEMPLRAASSTERERRVAQAQAGDGLEVVVERVQLAGRAKALDRLELARARPGSSARGSRGPHSRAGSPATARGRDDRPLLEREHRRARAREGERRLDGVGALRVGRDVCRPHRRVQRHALASRRRRR